MQQNKRKLKPHKLETLPLKSVLQASSVIQTKWKVTKTKNLKNPIVQNHFATLLDRKQNKITLLLQKLSTLQNYL